MALLEHTIEAYNREGSIHELSAETWSVLDDPDASPDRVRAAAAEIDLVGSAFRLLATPPSTETFRLVRDLLAEGGTDG